MVATTEAGPYAYNETEIIYEKGTKQVGFARRNDSLFVFKVEIKPSQIVLKNDLNKILKIVNITGPPNDNIVARATVVKYSDKKSPVTIFQRKGVEPKVIGSFAYTGHGVQALENMTSRSPEAVNSGGKFLISLEREVRNATSAGDDALLAAQRRIRNW